MKTFAATAAAAVIALLPLADAAALRPRQASSATPTALSASAGAEFGLLANYAQAAYCMPSAGTTIKATGAKVVYATGDGRNTPRFYVAYDSAKNQIITSHQGTNTSSLLSILNDLEPSLVAPDSRISGCLDSGSSINDGFQETWALTADIALSQVKSQLAAHPGASVIVTGHSLGASVSSLDYILFKCKLPSTTNIRPVLYAQPRTGNVPYANSLDRLSGNTYRHIINGEDVVPHLPPQGLGSRRRDLSPDAQAEVSAKVARGEHVDELLARAVDGYWSPGGEVWINPANSGSAVLCPGQENTQCSDSTSVFSRNAADHLGTYFGTKIAGADATACAATVA